MERRLHKNDINQICRPCAHTRFMYIFKFMFIGAIVTVLEGIMFPSIVILVTIEGLSRSERTRKSF